MLTSSEAVKENKYEGLQQTAVIFTEIGYGVGDAGSNLCWSFIATFIMIYCTNTLGISAAAVGTLMMLSKILDGVSDVLMGRIIDATHHRMGKARFWYAGNGTGFFRDGKLYIGITSWEESGEADRFRKDKG